MAPPAQLTERSRPPSDQEKLGSPRKPVRASSSPVRLASDRWLARRASKGDRRAIAAIFERYQHELYGFCLGLLGEPQDAQDALQNTMVKVLRALPGEEREIALRPWLYRIAHNEAIELRRHRRPTQALDSYMVDGQASIAERAEQREQLEWLLKDLGDLPERQRTVLVMRELSGLDFAEIGAALDTTGAVVRQTVYEARRNLEQMDRGRGLECEAVTRVLSDSDGRITRRRDIRAHLRDCSDCRRFRDAIDRREGVLASIPPLPTAVASAGIAQTALGGSGGSGTVAALTGGAAKSAGVYGTLKAAGTIAAVAVVGTAAIRSEMKNATPSPPPRPALAQTREDGSSSSTGRGRADSASPHAGQAAEDRSAAAVGARISHRGPRSPAVGGHGAAAEAVRRPAARSPAEAYAADPATTDQAGKAPEEAKERSSNGEKNAPPGDGKGNPARAEKPEKQAGPSPESQQEKPEHPAHPVHPPHPKKATTTAAADPAPPSESDPEEGKVPPGQAKKQAKAEVQQPPPALPAAVETEPAAAAAEATDPAEASAPHGKARGHEK